MNSLQESQTYLTAPYRRSRWAYCIECAFEYFVALMVQGTFLATLLTHIGLSDATIGIISSFISLAFLFQLFSIPVVRRISNIKRFAVPVHCVAQLLFGFLYVVPFLPLPYQYKAALVIGCLLLGYFGNYLVASMIYKWGNSYVDPHHRASFTAGKEMISLLCGMAVTLIAGYVTDFFQAQDQQEKAFVFVAIAVFIYCVCDFICLMMIKNDLNFSAIQDPSAPGKKAPRASLRDVWKNTVCNKNFRYVVLVACFWSSAQYFTIGFLGTYQINGHELAFSMGTVQLLAIFGSLARVTVSRPFGRYSDRHSYASGVKLGLLIAACAFSCVVFTTPSTRYLIIVYIILYGVCCAGTNANLQNIIYHYVDSHYFVQATAIKNSVAGLCGFSASLVASKLLSHIQGNGNRLFGIPLYGQQLLGMISLTIVVCAIFFVHFVLGRQKATGK